MRVGCVDEQVIGCLIAKAGAVGRLVRLVQHLDDPGGEVEHAGVQRLPDAEAGIEAAGEGGDEGLLATVPALLFTGVAGAEERSVGKECVRTGTSRWARCNKQ